LASRKTAWRDYEGEVMLGPKAQAVIQPYLNRIAKTLERYGFSPRESEEQRNELRQKAAELALKLG